MSEHKELCECGQDHSATSAKLKALFDEVLPLIENHGISGVMVSAMVQSEGDHYAVDCGVAFSDHVPPTHRLSATSLLLDNADAMLEQMREDAEIATAPTTETLQ